jgi:hypothetical protein
MLFYVEFVSYICWQISGTEKNSHARTRVEFFQREIRIVHLLANSMIGGIRFCTLVCILIQ